MNSLSGRSAIFPAAGVCALTSPEALICRSDLLLLDEPTNHLDLDAVIWLEKWLKGYTGTLILISHDRDFLDPIVDKIIHIEQQTMFEYTGNYSSFEVQRATRLAQQQAMYEKPAAARRAPAKLYRSLPCQSHQGQAGAKPDQNAGADGAYRSGARG